MVVEAPNRGLDYSKIAPIDLLKRGIITELSEVIPISQVDVEASIVDEGHADDLSASMAQRRGQIMAIGVRARLVEGDQIRYDVFDGFHRTEALRRLHLRRLAEDPTTPPATVKASVVYGCNDEELFDLRILAAGSVKSVQFPRMAEWMKRSYAETNWANRGISVLQAFTIAVGVNRTSRVAGLDEGEVKRLREEIHEKCSKWRKTATSVLRILELDDASDPDLIRQVRVSGGGKDRHGKITPVRLAAVVSQYPGEECYAIQRELLSYVVDNRLTAEETGLLIKALKPEIKSGMSGDQVKEVLSTVNLEVLSSILKGTVSEADEYTGEETSFAEEAAERELEDILEAVPASNELEEPDDEIIQALEKRLENTNGATLSPEDALLRAIGEGIGSDEEFASDNTNHRVSVIHTEVTEHGIGSYGDGLTPAERLQAKIAEQAQIIKDLEARDGGARNEWWLAAPYISRDERKVMRALHTERRSIQDVAAELKETPIRIGLLVVSAWVKFGHNNPNAELLAIEPARRGRPTNEVVRAREEELRKLGIESETPAAGI